MFATTVDKILADFAKTINKLEAHAEQKEAEYVNTTLAILDLQEKGLAAGQEKDRALKIVNNIRALIN